MSHEVENDNTITLQIRHELKVWEKQFAAAHEGRKAGRDDIRKDATIAAKYQEYNKLTRKPAEPVATPRKKAKLEHISEHEAALKERSVNAVSTTPRKNVEEAKSLQLPEEDTVEELQPTPACVRFALGPTPQKDGEILGIFDMLPTVTPSKSVSIVDPDAVVGATPSKTAAAPSTELLLSRTPQSSAKRYFLDAFAGTPLKSKREGEVYTPSTSKKQFATPSFLRRNFSLAPIDEEGQEAAMAAPPFKKRGLVRSLSTIIQGLKKQEEKRMDDDWDVLNEIEAEGEDWHGRPSIPKVLIEDSQVAEMPLGPDQGAESSDEAGDVDPGALDANGKPRKSWKKKGLKRQTRRVIMRPVSHKSTMAASVDAEESDPEGVGETQLQDDGLKQKHPPGSGSESDEDQHEQSGHAKTKSKKKAILDDVDASKKPKKVNALAHANFRRLKIKNKNSKANGRGRKFGRR